MQSNIEHSRLEIQTALQLFSSGSEQFPDHFWEFFSFIAFGNLSTTKDLYEQLDRMDVVSWQLPLVEIGKAKFLSLSGHLFNSHTTFQNVNKLIDEPNRCPSPGIENEIIAFYYYEQALLAEKNRDSFRTKLYLQAGNRLTSNRKFGLAYRMVMQIQNVKINSTDMPKLLNSIEQLESERVFTLASIGWRTAGILARISKDFPTAQKYFDSALSLATQFKLKIVANQTHLSLSILHNELADRIKAESSLEAIQPYGSLDPIVPSIHEVRALMAEKDGDHQEAVGLVQKALDISLELDQVAMVPDEALYLGNKYQNHFKDLEKAEHYYRIGYEHAIRYAENGISLTGDRKKVVDAYLQLLQSKGKSVPDNRTIINPFSYTKGRPWRDIKDIFQHQLLIHHARTTSTSRGIASKLGMPPTTLYSLQARLKKRGYLLPDKTPTQDDDAHEVQEFIVRHEELSWEEINAIFEREVIHYLYEKYGYNKQRMANILELSYPALINKTRELTQVDEHFLPN